MRRIADQSIPTRFSGYTAAAALVLVSAGIVVGLATFLVLTGMTPIRPSDLVISRFLKANFTVVVLMALLVVFQLVQLLRERTKGTAGAGLHLRLVGLFSIVAVAPALLVAAFAAVTLNRGLDAWFSERTRNIVDTATTVAEAYLTNAGEATRNDLAGISQDLSQQTELYKTDRQAFVRRVARHAALRNLAGVYVFDPASKRIDVSVTANDRIRFIAPEEFNLEKAKSGDAVVIQPGRGGNVVRAMVKLQGYDNLYLYIYRLISPVVIDQLTKTRDAKAEYDRMLAQREGVQVTFGLVYALVALVFLLAAIWAGLRFADNLVAPIVRLLNAARDVARGNFSAKVATVDGPGDLVTLSNTFNMMTDQIALHRDQLVYTNEQLDARRRFTEAMLSGVSAGVIGVDPDSRISIVNRSAMNLLGKTEGDLVGTSLTDSVPALSKLFELAVSRPSGSAEGQVELIADGRDKNLFVRITTERSDDAEHGFVITFDDITDLVSAQRNSAWADIARRIAHEIKNPLTPIQLSAERLKRKYLKEITSDKVVFEQCTDTIIRQVGDLGRIVDEFSSFARMPKAVPEPNSLQDVVSDATVLQRVSAADTRIEIRNESDVPIFAFDRRLVTQAVTNLVKNAREAIEPRLTGHEIGQGHIIVSYGMRNGAPYLSVTDNGIGLPQENRHRLAEPYMTTREKGTGLGLAIVKRIMEEHGGSLSLTDSPDGQGARVTLNFPPIEVLEHTPVEDALS
ncbi:MAG: PAS domain-containing sensor histidine kinase [Rhizobiales bacterium]|nr:PAS domain-containing sensor histidine kinase [Hyphomicrobiales bacterium]